MALRTVTDERVARFVSEHIGRGLCPPFQGLGLEKDGEIIAGVIFNCFEGRDVHVTIAGRGWTKGFLADVGDYVFRQLRCARLTALTEHPQIVSFGERLGGQVEGLLRDHFGQGRDAFVIGILKHDYRF